VTGLSYVERHQTANPGSLLGQMLTVRQAAVRMGITEGALRQRLLSGTAPAHHRLGKRVMFKSTDVEAGK
jgi:excisionase family DNA binding protein